MESSQPQPAASSSGDLPRDALLEIFLRIAAKDLCRLRAVCPSWRALTCDPLFVAEHKSRHPDPLLAMAYRDQGTNGVDVVDLSGNIVRRIPSIESDILATDESGHVFAMIPRSQDSICVLRTRLDLICFTRELHPLGLWVLNPATGASRLLPECHSEELAYDDEIQRHYGYGGVESSCALGQISSTGEYKAIRIVSAGDRQLCEVITLDGTDHGRWRGKQSPPCLIFAGRSERMRCVVVDGVVYFLMDFYFTIFNSGVITIEPGSIASFNLETEEWMGTLRGPAPVRTFIQDHEDFCYGHLNLQLSLAELDGSLVTVHNNHNISMNLWFLTDFENAIWEKKYNFPSYVAQLCVYPFLVLHDGRILFCHGNGILFPHGNGFLKVYDPKTAAYTDALEVKDSRSIGIYTGSLLSL